ncbi:alpha/beta hydrolase [uncultured Aquimarina sp.]|uniref:alpha/beta fold hydrolase n=1 Tax=uncultured Aquimarina sp. TaxID=575652 RepID=UPI002604C30C|nr:alpha/beta hydrolase [uncultured Aquimarina sp.]
MTSLFKSSQGRKDILRLYEEKLDELRIKYEYLSINSSYGKTNIIATGISNKPPIILVHGSNGCAPIALETYPNLSKKFRVYAIDVLAQPNKSAEIRLSMKDDSYGKWMSEIINSLKIENVVLAGFSFGGLVILKTLEYDESKIKEVYLSSPAYIVNGNPIKILFKIFIPMKRFIKTKKNKYVEQFLSKVFTERDEFAVKFLAKVFLHFSMDFTPVPIIQARKANAIRTPITVFAGENDILFPGNKMIKRAKNIFPSLKNIKLIKDSKHVLNRKQNESIEKVILENNAL